MLIIMLGFSYFLGKRGVIAPQVGIENIIKYFIDIVLLSPLPTLF